MSNIVAVLQGHALNNPDKVACIHLADGTQITSQITYAELDRKAQSIAAELLSRSLQGQRVLLLYPSGVDFVTAFFGCLYAGVTAVPVNCSTISEIEKNSALLRSIAEDAEITAILLPTEYISKVNQQFSKKFSCIDIQEYNSTASGDYKLPIIQQNTVVYLQYTSGSTSNPKGAIITHRSLTHSLLATIDAWKYTEDSVTVNWAPHSHVYGLVCGILIPIYHGTPAVLIPTHTFINNPLCWLESITRFKATHGGCPNFGYEVCIRAINDDEKYDFDLSTWTTAVNGGENVQQSTLEKFALKAAKYGFEIAHFCPAFGMSEMSGAITSKSHGEAPRKIDLSIEGLKDNKAIEAELDTSSRQFVSNGKLINELHVAIVNPETSLLAQENEIGEIWLSGMSTASGYWNREKETQDNFNLKVAGSRYKYFRTGDLGFVMNNELFITGRVKELLIVNGKKYYPLDIEVAVKQGLSQYSHCHQCIVMSLPQEDNTLIFLQEIEEHPTSELNEINHKIRHIILEKFGLHVSKVEFIKKNTIPKTSSGKIQRSRCLQLYTDMKVDFINEQASVNINKNQNNDLFIDECKKIISETLQIKLHELDLNASVSEYNFDSINIIKLASALNKHFHLNLSPAVLFEYKTIAQFISALKPALLPKPEAVQIIENESESENNLVTDYNQSNDIAIIGIAGMFPEAETIESFWDNLVDAKNAITEIPGVRWNWKSIYGDPKEPGKTNIKWGGFVNNIAEFDADFFNIAPREAELTDPQQRIFLQTVWRTLEDAGYTPAQLAKVKTGLFVGVFKSDYAEVLQENNVHDAYNTTSITQSILANRVSYILNFNGPSEVIDTACSSSLVAIHNAIRSIHAGDCDVAIAGGVNALISPTSYIAAGKAGMLSIDGRCKTFDENANGYVRGEGVGAILLKPLKQAILDHDNIYAIIKGSAVNHGGHVSSLTVPNPNAQADVIIEANRRAKISIDSLNYIETHGTGTSLGDPIEINGLKLAFKALAQEQGIKLDNYYCHLGALKTHIGHLESAAGIASVIKVLLCMKHKMLPSNLNFAKLNPFIQMNDTPFVIQETTTEWNAKDKNPLRAGVSSFGFGGTNAHIVIEEYISNSASGNKIKNKPFLIVLSAKTKSSLQEQASNLLSYLKQVKSTAKLDRIGNTLCNGRQHFSLRYAMVVNNVNELIATLESVTQGSEDKKYFHNIELPSKKSKTLEKILRQLESQIQSASGDDYSEKLTALAEFYIQGYDIQFNNLYDTSLVKLSLPTYPFAKTEYWVPKNKNQISAKRTMISRRVKTSVPSNQSVQALQDLIQSYVAEILKKDKKQFSFSDSLNDLGFESISYKELAAKLESQYKIEVTPSIFFTHTSIAMLAEHLFPLINTQANQEETYSDEVIESDMSNRHEPIAIIGMHAYLPESKNLDDFWQHLVLGDDLVTEISPDRWDWRQYFGDSKANPLKTNSKWGARISNVDSFDASFFNISSREANLMDPQHRLFMESVWSAVEDAGYDPLSLGHQKIGLFVGVEFSDYQDLILAQRNIFHGYTATGNSHSVLANRMSYFLDLRGPSEAIDTACSSSLVAIHRAISALQNGECRAAIAGGVSLMLNPETFIITSQLGVLSPDGHCKTFDKSANGYVKGEGIASLLLKPLSLAEQDGDHVYGIIRGSAVNHGGKAQSLTAPNPQAQTELLIDAYTRADVDPSTVTYIEAHGTGTELGDPIEIDGLKAAFHAFQVNPNDKRCGIGSVKTNIGHLEPASGIAGVIKVLLAMQHKTLPATIHFNELNPFINLENTPFYIVDKTQPWNRIADMSGNEIPRRAGVSSFGFGGTNAHIVMEEYEQNMQNVEQDKPYYLITVSTKIFESLTIKVNELHAFLKEKSSQYTLESLSYTLNIGRSHFANRIAIITKSIPDLLLALEKIMRNESTNDYMVSEQSQFEVSSPLFNEIYQSTIQSLSANLSGQQYYEKMRILADLYTKRFPINFAMLYQDSKPTRIHALPTYPFNKQRYWYDQEAASEKLNSITVARPQQNKSIAKSSYSQSLIIYLKNRFAEKLRINPENIDVNETYEVYGVDSLLGLEITNRLEQDFGTLPKTLLYEKNKIVLLATYLNNKHADKVATLFPDQQIENLEIISPTVMNIEKSNALIDRDIAIIGLDGIFPMADSLEEFWANLSHGKDCITEIPADRWNYKDYPVQVGGEEKYYQYGGFINDIDKFDPLFFSIAPRDAALMDPQERIFMQSAWNTLENAGYTRGRLQQAVNNNVGVFVGVTYNFYPLFIAEEWSKGNRIPLDIQLFSIANRFSYFLNLNGPSFIIDTACSSSLAAIHQACESIIAGECKMAIAGGVNLSLHPAKYHMLGSYSFMSDQGRCSSFAEGGNGYVPSEGVGAVLLKPLADALRDNDRIYGVIKATSMNHGGKTSGYTVPNPNAQADLIKATLAKANIDARTISYIEAHGTGTSLGDPIEIRGLQEAFEVYTQDKQYCAIGSVKSNIGHLESAAGISQLSKVLLQLEHKQLVPSIHSEKLNPFIQFDDTPFYVQHKLEEWKTNTNTPRRAGVSSFGAGGTNVHMIVEEYQVPESTSQTTAPYLMVLSALNSERLQQYVSKTHQFLTAHQPDFTNDAMLNRWLENLSYTSLIGRESMTSRVAVLFTSIDDLLQKLSLLQAELKSQPDIWFNNAAQLVNSSENIDEYMKSREYEKLAALWVSGVKIKWENLYDSNQVKIVNFPTYPFAKRSCWVTPKVQGEKIAQIKNSELAVKEKKWLILSDLELGLLLQDGLGKNNCVYCFESDSFVKHDNSTYYANSKSITEIIELINHLEINSIICLWSDSTLLTELNKHVNAPVYYTTRNNEQFPALPNTTVIQLKKKINLRRDAKIIVDQVNQASAIDPAVIEPKQVEKIKRIVVDKEPILDLIITTCARLLALEIRELDPEIPFQNYGMDSIIGINFISELNITYPELLSPMDLYRYPTINQLVNYIVESIQPSETQTTDNSKPVSIEMSEEAMFEEIKHLSDAEISKLLEAELSELGEIL